MAIPEFNALNNFLNSLIIKNPFLESSMISGVIGISFGVGCGIDLGVALGVALEIPLGATLDLAPGFLVIIVTVVSLPASLLDSAMDFPDSSTCFFKSSSTKRSMSSLFNPEIFKPLSLSNLCN